jgi:hypothetical protein
MVREGERMRLHALLVVLVLVPFASHAFTKARCTATQHAIEEREPRPVLLISGFATLTGGVAALSSGRQGMIATSYLLSVPFLPALVGLMSLPCEVDPSLPETPLQTSDALRQSHRGSNWDALWIVGFNTAVAGTTVLLSQNQTSRVVAGIATGLSAISPLFYLGRFFDDGTPDRVSAQLGVPTQITLRF